MIVPPFYFSFGDGEMYSFYSPVGRFLRCDLSAVYAHQIQTAGLDIIVDEVAFFDKD